MATEINTTVQYRTIKRFVGYRFGDDGSIWSCWQRYGQGKKRLGDEWKQIKQTKGSRGYLFVRLCENGGPAAKVVLLSHRLILEAFTETAPPDADCCHDNGDKADNRIANLRWDTRTANHADKWRHSRMPHGKSHHNSKLIEADVLMIRSMHADGFTQRFIARVFGTNPGNVCAIVNRKAWKWLTSNT